MKRGMALFTVVTVIFMVVGVGIGMLLTNINQRQAEGNTYPLKVVDIVEGELDPEVWGQNFPRHYDSFMRTQEDYGRTSFGGSTPISKIEEKPFLTTAWAGYAFAIDYNEDRGHFYANIDQQNTKRTTERNQPATCVQCHAAEAVTLNAEVGFENVGTLAYNDIKGDMHTGSSCADCHDASTMALKISRPAFINAMAERGIDVNQASRQDMRTYVCAQCHVEYYFAGENKVLTFPWSQGTSIENILAHYEQYAFQDWQHALTQSPMLKMQHPEFEMFTSSTHYKSGVACADCHMPYTREGGIKVSDHWIRSPLNNINNACQSCHKQSEDALIERVISIQNRTKAMMNVTEAALADAIHAIVTAMEAGASDEALSEARQLHREAQAYWDFVDAENSMGFHSPQEATRILGVGADLARQAQLSAVQATPQAVTVAEQ